MAAIGGYVGTNTVRKHISTLFARLKTHRRVILVAVLVAIAVAGGVWYYRTQVPLPEIKTMSYGEATKYQIDTLSNTPLSPTASADEKAKHYELLSYYKLQANDIQGAADALAAKDREVPQKMDYSEYLHLARLYQNLKRNDDALQALSKCEKILPAEDNGATGYVRDDIVAQITKMRQELAQ